MKEKRIGKDNVKYKTPSEVSAVLFVKKESVGYFCHCYVFLMIPSALFFFLEDTELL